MIVSSDVTPAYLYRRLGQVEARVRSAVMRRRAGDTDPDDKFRGLYITDAHVDQLLSAAHRLKEPAPPDPEASTLAAEIESQADEAERQGENIRLRRLARSFGLDTYDVELLLITLAPDLDPRFERLYGYLHDDVSRRRASTGLALELCRGTFATGADRGRLSPDGALVSGGLLVIEDLDRPFLTRSMRVPDRVTAYLLGDDSPDPVVSFLLSPYVEAELEGIDRFVQALKSGTALTYLREGPGGAGLSLGATALVRAGMTPIVLDLGRIDTSDSLKEISLAAAREARLQEGGIVSGPVEALAEKGAAAVRAFAESPCPVILHGARGWDPHWSRLVPLLLDASAPGTKEREVIWLRALDGSLSGKIDPASVTNQFRLSPEQIVRAANAALLQAQAAGHTLRVSDLHSGARAQNAAGLEKLAHRREPKAAWGDLVLPVDVLSQLREITARVRHRELVLEDWGMGDRSSRGRGVSALFAGESGTGKTLSAEVVAGDLGLDLYVIDLSTVVDKYIGETEKNLERIFVEADRVNGVLLFDEADAIFGKRSEVKDAHDRYANVETAYLLQRMERFDGLAILTSNLRSNVDEAFIRRLDAIVDFPMPEAQDRRQLWIQHLRPEVPRAEDIDFDFLARSFKMSGGNIRNIVLAATYLAAEERRPVEMAHLIRATQREYIKLGRLTVEDEFGPYYELLTATSAKS